MHVATDEGDEPKSWTKRFWSVKLEDGTIAYAATDTLIKALIDESLDGG